MRDVLLPSNVNSGENEGFNNGGRKSVNKPQTIIICVFGSVPSIIWYVFILPLVEAAELLLALLAPSIR